MKRLKNELSWSVSRRNTLNFCERQYFYDYYLSWEGWKKHGAQERQRTAYLLKKRDNMSGWTGKKTHESIMMFIEKRGSCEEFIRSMIRSAMKNEFRISESKKYLETGNYKDFGLIEHYRGEDISDIDMERCIKKVMDNFDAFLSSDYREQVIGAIEEGRRYGVDTQDFNKMKFSLPAVRGVTVFANPDIYFEVSEGRFLLLDWKTGREDDNGGMPLQLSTCGLKLEVENSITPDTCRIEAYNVYLPSMTLQGGVLTKKDMEEAVSTISADIEKMRGYLEDIRENSPLPEDNFKQTLSTAKCKRCNYRELCNVESGESEESFPETLF